MSDVTIPTGNLQGDTAPMPDRGTTTGMNGDSYGANLGQDSTNRMGGLGNAAKSDAMFDAESDGDTPDGDD